MPKELRDHLKVSFAILERGDWSQEVPGVCQPVGADGSKIGQAEMRSVVLADVAARRALRKFHAELETAWDDTNVSRSRLQNSEFRGNQVTPQLRHGSQFAVGMIELAVSHG